MAKYTADYLSSHDIDWFCKINDRPIHCASNGGTLPTNINDKQTNIVNQINAYGLNYVYSIDKIEINTKYIDKRFKDGKNKYTVWELEKMKYNYLKTFIDMAMRGFYSFDRKEYNKYKSNQYVPIAWPHRYDPTHEIKIEGGNFNNPKIDFESLNTNKTICFKNLK